MANEGPGTWSPHVVLRHLIYGEKTDWMPRLRIMMEHGASPEGDVVVVFSNGGFGGIHQKLLAPRGSS